MGQRRVLAACLDSAFTVKTCLFRLVIGAVGREPYCCKAGGQAVGYQGRKAPKASNALFLADNTGQMLALSEPQEGQCHDLHEIKALFAELCDLLKEADIDSKGVFLNAGPGFDSKKLRSLCNEKEIEANIKPNLRNQKKDNDEDQYFDEELYKRRTVIEHANAWMDGLKAWSSDMNLGKKLDGNALHGLLSVLPQKNQ